jgi:hypothetical protein
MGAPKRASYTDEAGGASGVAAGNDPIISGSGRDCCNFPGFYLRSGWVTLPEVGAETRQMIDVTSLEGECNERPE